jgi:hypothetical protein
MRDLGSSSHVTVVNETLFSTVQERMNESINHQNSKLMNEGSWRAMALLAIDENLEDGDRFVPDLGFSGSFSLMMAICGHCKRSSIA